MARWKQYKKRQEGSLTTTSSFRQISVLFAMIGEQISVQIGNAVNRWRAENAFPQIVRFGKVFCIWFGMQCGMRCCASTGRRVNRIRYFSDWRSTKNLLRHFGLLPRFQCALRLFALQLSIPTMYRIICTVLNYNVLQYARILLMYLKVFSNIKIYYCLCTVL